MFTVKLWRLKYSAEVGRQGHGHAILIGNKRQSKLTTSESNSGEPTSQDFTQQK